MEQIQPTEELFTLRDRGWTIQQMADVIGLTYGTFRRRRRLGTLTEDHLYIFRGAVGAWAEPSSVITAGVYYMRPRSSPFVKIGFTGNIDRRTQALQVGSPEPLDLIAWFPSPQSSEPVHHARWAKRHFRGEWFYYHPDMDHKEDNMSPAQDTPDELAALM